MDTVNPFSLQQVTSIAASTSSILESKEPIPPEVRHYLTLLRQLCGDVNKLHDLRERRIEYLRAAPYDLNEANGILAVSMLGAARFESILSKYRPTSQPEATEELRDATTRSEATMWKPEDIQELCKMAENLPFQMEAIGATIGKLEEGSSRNNEVKGTEEEVVRPMSSKRISNIHLLNSMFGSTVDVATRNLQRSDSLASSIAVIETAAQVVVSKQEKPALVCVQSSPRNSRSSFTSSRTSATHSGNFLEGSLDKEQEKGSTPRSLENDQWGVYFGPHSVGASTARKKPDRKVGLQALFSAPVPLGGGSLYSPPSTTKPPSTTTTRPLPEADASDRPGITESHLPRITQGHILPTPKPVMQSSLHKHKAVPESTSRSSQDEGSFCSLVQEEKMMISQSSSLPASSQPPLMHFPPPTPIQARHTFSEMSTLPEVVVEEPVWWIQRQRQQQQSREQLPIRTPSTQARYASAKAAELQRMFAPVAKLGASRPDISHVRAAAAAGFGRPPQSGASSLNHAALSKQRHYSLPPPTTKYNDRTRPQSQAAPSGKIMFYELDSCTTVDSISSMPSKTTTVVKSADDAYEVRNRVDSVSSQESASISAASIYSPPPIYESDGSEGSSEGSVICAAPKLPQQPNVNRSSIVRISNEDLPLEGNGSETDNKEQSSTRQDSCITPTPSVFRRSRNRTDSGAWVRRTQMFRAERSIDT